MKITDKQIEEMVDFYHKGDNHFARHDFREGAKAVRDYLEAQIKSQESDCLHNVSGILKDKS